MDDSQIAFVAYEAVRVYQRIVGEELAPPWEITTPAQKLIVVDAVNRAQAGQTAQFMQENWMSDQTALGWGFGLVYDPIAKKNPLMIDWTDMSNDQKNKWQMLRAIVNVLS